jgi:amino acid permease
MYIIINIRTGLRAKQNTTSRFNIYINKRISLWIDIIIPVFEYWLVGRAQLPNTILEKDHPKTIPSKVGSNWATGSRQDGFYVNFP